jgi:hypothetical protein
MSGPCHVAGCNAKPVAKGLCAKHYMRQRWTRDPNTVGKPGRKPDLYLQMVRAGSW